MNIGLLRRIGSTIQYAHMEAVGQKERPIGELIQVVQAALVEEKEISSNEIPITARRP